MAYQLYKGKRVFILDGIPILPPPEDAPSYPPSQIHRYTPSSAISSAWNDAIGTKHLINSNATFNGNEWVFNGTNSFLYQDAMTGLIPATGDFTLSILQQSSVTGLQISWSQYTLGASNGRVHNAIDLGTPLSQLFLGNDNGGIPTINVSEPTPSNSSGYQYLIYQRQGNIFRIRNYNNAWAEHTDSGSRNILQVRFVVGARSISTTNNAIDNMSDFWNGGIKYLSLCNTALTSLEIESEYNKALTL